MSFVSAIPFQGQATILDSIGQLDRRLFLLASNDGPGLCAFWQGIESPLWGTTPTSGPPDSSPTLVRPSAAATAEPFNINEN